MAYRASSTANDNGDVTTITIPKPTGTLENDIIVAYASIDATTATGFNWVALGFTLLDTATSTYDGQIITWAWKRAGASEAASWALTWTNAAPTLGGAVSFSGRHLTDPPVAGTTNNPNSSHGPGAFNIDANGVTVISGDDLLWLAVTDQDANSGTMTGFTAPTNFTEQIEQLNGGNGWSSASACTWDDATTGATGTVTGTGPVDTGFTTSYVSSLIRIPTAPTDHQDFYITRDLV